MSESPEVLENVGMVLFASVRGKRILRVFRRIESTTRFDLLRLIAQKVDLASINPDADYVNAFVAEENEQFVPSILEGIGRDAKNPELRFSWYDAAELSQFNYHTPDE